MNMMNGNNPQSWRVGDGLIPIGSELSWFVNCPMFSQLVDDLVRQTQAPVDLVVMAILSYLSILYQGLIDVDRPVVGVGPVSLFTLAIAESGERKSTVSKILEKPIAEFQIAESERYAEELEQYQFEKAVYDSEVANLRKIIALKSRKEV